MAGRPRLYAVAKNNYNIDMDIGPWGIDSRFSLMGAKYAEEQGKEIGEAYHDAMFRAYFTEAKDISDFDVLAEIAESVGLKRDPYLAAIVDPKYEDMVRTDHAIAHQSGMTGVPALVFESKYLVMGAQPYDVLSKFVEDLQEKLAEE